MTITKTDADVIRVIAKMIDLEGYKDSARSLYDIADRASLVGVERAAPPVRAREETAREAQETWAHIEHLLVHECGLHSDEGLEHQRSNCINAIINGPPRDPALLRAAVELLRSGMGLHKIRVNGKMMDREQVAAAILSSTAGQEWREPEGWRKTLENAALFLEIGAGYAPNEVVDERIKATKERLKLRGLRDVMRAVAKDCRDALLPAPPVAEPLLAEKSEVKS